MHGHRILLLGSHLPHQQLKPGGIIENRQVVTVEGKGCPAPDGGAGDLSIVFLLCVMRKLKCDREVGKEKAESKLECFVESIIL